ncbi:hypothetical protein FF38_08242 [Lucilia cuprina]|uniref:Uncharacterized protein n=1 Tax=Lucilia cuprina TaxID=7375 RepID=A0A0L0BYN9_LUCCU|nr:hypothetical protein CVS40_10422 [Lucilia cuprina]KNC25157.1 hypothetical protein FF38_08242 [Lucilia cuprina]
MLKKLFVLILLMFVIGHFQTVECGIKEVPLNCEYVDYNGKCIYKSSTSKPTKPLVLKPYPKKKHVYQ